MSHIILTDERIRELISEPKDVPEGLGSLGRPMPARNGHRHKEFDVASSSENLFFIKLRQLCANPLDFSVILVVGHGHRRKYEMYIAYFLKRWMGLNREFLIQWLVI
jgi:hypothetical protein